MVARVMPRDACRADSGCKRRICPTCDCPKFGISGPATAALLLAVSLSVSLSVVVRACRVPAAGAKSHIEQRVPADLRAVAGEAGGGAVPHRRRGAPHARRHAHAR